MNKFSAALIVILVVVIGAGFFLFNKSRGDQNSSGITSTQDAHEDGAEANHDDGEEVGHDEGGADTVEISADAAAKSGITVATAGSGTVRETVTLTGRIALNRKTTAQIRARFAGIVREVKHSQGDTVKAGDVLAIVESNDSLQLYPVKSPLDGVIVALNTNIGDVASDASLFTVADVSDVWAEFHTFPRDIDRIRKDQKVTVTSFEGSHTGTAPIVAILSVAEASSQTIVARVVLPNDEGVWHSGMTVRGDVLINERQVPLVVKSTAVQRVEGKSVVFVRSGDDYSMRPVVLGLADAEWIEVREGLNAGEIYVSQNSFMIKADLGKASAEHGH